LAYLHRVGRPQTRRFDVFPLHEERLGARRSILRVCARKGSFTSTSSGRPTKYVVPASGIEKGAAAGASERGLQGLKTRPNNRAAPDKAGPWAPFKRVCERAIEILAERMAEIGRNAGPRRLRSGDRRASAAGRSAEQLAGPRQCLAGGDDGTSLTRLVVEEFTRSARLWPSWPRPGPAL